MSVVTVVATADSANVPPRVRLDVTDTGNSPAYTEVTLNRTDPDGRTVPVRTADGNPLTLTGGGPRTGLIYDYEMPYGEAVTYTTAESPDQVSAPVTVAEDRPWLVHPGVPALSQPIDLRINSFDEEELPVERTVSYPMGRASAVVRTEGVRRSGGSSFTVGCETLPQAAAIRALISDAGTLLLNVPASTGLAIERQYIAVGDVRIKRRSTIGTDPYRDVEMPYVRVDRPAGGSQAQRTYVDLLTFPTYAALNAAYPTYTALLAGP